MFKKLYNEIQELQKYLDTIIHEVRDMYRELSQNISLIKNNTSHLSKLGSLERTIDSQQQTIKALSSALTDKYEHGLFVFSEDCKVITVIRNGKELPVNLMDFVEISWHAGETPVITMEQFAGTVSDSDI